MKMLLEHRIGPHPITDRLGRHWGTLLKA